jgi:hypothetical protein
MGIYMSTLTQFLSGKLSSQEFTSSGNFTVPAGVTTVWVTMIGGGGSGANNGSNGGGGGAGGAFCYKSPVTVTPGATVSVTIGSGGAGVTAPNNGNAGGTTSFGSLSVSGGGPGYQANQSSTGGVGGSNGGSGSSNTIYWPPELAQGCMLGGKGGRSILNVYYYGGGGGGFGDGTDANTAGASTSAAANSGAGSGAGAGGTNGAGGSGKCIVEWLS